MISEESCDTEDCRNYAEIQICYHRNKLHLCLLTYNWPKSILQPVLGTVHVGCVILFSLCYLKKKVNMQTGFFVYFFTSNAMNPTFLRCSIEIIEL